MASKSINYHFKTAEGVAKWFNHQRTINGTLDGYHDGNTHLATEGALMLLKGTENNVSMAHSMMNDIVRHVETPAPEWQLSVAGAFPDVVAYNAGLPENMWTMVPTNTNKAPLHVWIGLSSEWNITNEQLAMRGAALAAFALAMTNVRPVVITPFVALSGHDYSGGWRSRRRNRDYKVPEHRNCIISWQIPTSPLVLSELMTISCAEVTRYFGIEACQQVFGKVANDDGSFHDDSWYEDKMRAHLQCKPDDLYLKQILSTDRYLSDPVGWVNEMVTRFTSGETGDYTDDEILRSSSNWDRREGRR